MDRGRAATTARALGRVAPPWRAPVALESLGARRARGLVGTAAARAGRVVASASDDAEEDDVDRVVDANDFESEDADEGAVRAADEAVVGARVDADVDELLSSVRTTTTWGGDWAEFVIFLARLQALGYSGVNADEIVVAAGDSQTPEWARGVSRAGDDAAAAPGAAGARREDARERGLEFARGVDAASDARNNGFDKQRIRVENGFDRERTRVSSRAFC